MTTVLRYVPADPVLHDDGTPDYRLPLPLPRLRRLGFGSHRDLIRQVRRYGLDDDEVFSEVVSAMLGTEGYDPTKMRRADSYVVAVSRSKLLSLLQKLRNAKRAHEDGSPVEVGIGGPDGEVYDAAAWASEYLAHEVPEDDDERDGEVSDSPTAPVELPEWVAVLIELGLVDDGRPRRRERVRAVPEVRLHPAQPFYVWVVELGLATWVA